MAANTSWKFQFCFELSWKGWCHLLWLWLFHWRLWQYQLWSYKFRNTKSKRLKMKALQRTHKICAYLYLNILYQIWLLMESTDCKQCNCSEKRVSVQIMFHTEIFQNQLLKIKSSHLKRACHLSIFENIKLFFKHNNSLQEEGLINFVSLAGA